MEGNAIEPDTKDWTWVLQRPCPDCGYDAGAVEPGRLPDLVRDNARAWQTVLGRDDVTDRPTASVWSPLEYACHVRDVHQIFTGRLTSMLEQDDPAFANWDQDDTALEKAYAEQLPERVAIELATAAEGVADVYARVSGDQWQRTGRRSDGAVFTVDTLGRYHLHDIVHHVHDVGA